MYHSIPWIVIGAVVALFAAIVYFEKDPFGDDTESNA